jgi:hypothetical protein
MPARDVGAGDRIVVNARTAKQLGISVSPTLLTLADEVIE